MNSHDGSGTGAPNPGHETRDINVRRIVIYAAALVAMIALSMAAMKVTFDYFAQREARNQSPPATLATHLPDQLPPEPRLQSNPLLDLRELRASEAIRLTSFAWVDQRQGIVRIPVEEAMKLTVTRGLPHREDADPRATQAPQARGRP